MNNAILIPFRNDKDGSRQIQMNTWIKFKQDNLPKSVLCFCVQTNDLPFNRGLLLNAGVEFAEKKLKKSSFILHDVDLLPNDELLKYYCSSTYDNEVFHLARFGTRYSSNSNYFGGACRLSHTLFHRANGFPNNYFGWGGEDEEFRDRLRSVGAEFTNPKPYEAVIDLEDLSLKEKLSELKRTKAKNNFKWELRSLPQNASGMSSLSATCNILGVNQLEATIFELYVEPSMHDFTNAFI